MKRFKNILCVLEPGKACEPALQRATALAESNQAGLTVVDVVPRITAGIGMPEGGPISTSLQDAMTNDHHDKIEALIAPYRERLEIRIKILVGTPFLQIIREVLRGGHDLVIKVPEHQDWLDRFFGSDDMHLLRKCPCPVWLTKPEASTAYKHILAAVDVGQNYTPRQLKSRYALNCQILEMASSMALADFAELHIVHVWEAIGETVMRGGLMYTPEEKIAAYVDEVRQQHVESFELLLREVNHSVTGEALNYLKPRKHIVKGSARIEIPTLARKIGADLVVMGTVARTGVPGLIMGNTAESILNQLECSVLAIKPAGFVTPVTLEE